MTDLEQLKNRYPGAQTFKFGDNAALSDELLALVRAGKKTATCDALRNYPEGSLDMPVVGRRDIALNWDDHPVLVIETIEVTICRYCDVTECFALAEGENETLAGWRDDHRRYFERNGGFDPEMELVCERFRLVEDLAGKR
ncbi:MAG: ASCH domain-containing protein [Pseudomonadota bacterium]